MEVGNVPVGAPELVAGVGALFIPWVINAIKAENWSDTFKVIISFFFCAAWTAGSLWLTDRLFDPDHVYTVKDYVLVAFTVFFISHTSFKAWWEKKEDTQFSLRYR